MRDVTHGPMNVEELVRANSAWDCSDVYVAPVILLIGRRPAAQVDIVINCIAVVPSASGLIDTARAEFA